MNKISLRKFRDLKFLSSHFSSGLAIYYVSTCLSTERECSSRHGCQKLLKPKDISFKIFYMYGCFGYRCTMPHVCSSQRGQKRVLGLLGLKLWMIVSHGWWGPNQGPLKAASIVNHWVIFLAPLPPKYFNRYESFKRKKKVSEVAQRASLMTWVSSPKPK